MESEQIESRKRKRSKKRVQWSENQVLFLISLWEDHIDDFRGYRKNTHIFEEIKGQMEANGFKFTAEEDKIKIHNLTNRYKDEKKKIGPSGGSPSTWMFYDRVHAILGPYKSYSIDRVMDESLVVQPTTSEENSMSSFLVESLDDEFLIEALDESTIESIDDKNTGQAEVLADVPQKRKKLNMQSELLKRIDESNEIIKKEFEQIRKSDEQVLKIEKEIVEIERERNEILKLFLNNQK